MVKKWASYDHFIFLPSHKCPYPHPNTLTLSKHFNSIHNPCPNVLKVGVRVFRMRVRMLQVKVRVL
jgi:hypothetical protein